MVQPHEKMAGNGVARYRSPPNVKAGEIAVSILDADGTIVEWDDSCEKMFGLNAAQVVGKETPQSLAVKSYDLDDVLEEASRGGARDTDVMMTRSDGVPFLVCQSIKALPQESVKDSDYAYVCCLVNVTGDKQTEEGLRRERNRLNALVEAMGAGLALFDEKMQLRWANERLLTWFNIEKARGQLCCHVYHREGGQADCALARVHAGKAPVNTTTEYVDEDGQWRCYLNVITEVEIGYHRYLVLTTDITEERKQRERLRMIDRLSRVLQGSLNLDRVLDFTLLCVTAGHAFGFSRAFILLLSPDGTMLEGARAAGPVSEEKAERMWNQAARGGEGNLDNKELHIGLETERLTEQIQDVKIPTSRLVEPILGAHEPIFVKDPSEETGFPDDIRDELGLEEYVIVPLITGDTAEGLMIADNNLSGIALNEEGLKELQVFATQASMAIANAQAYRKIQEQVQRLRKTQKKLIESERLASVGRMAARLAHQIRTPLASIGGYAQAIMRSTSEDSKVHHNARIIYEEEQHLEAEVNETLELARPVKAEMEECDLNVLAERSVNQFLADRETDDVGFSLSLSEGLQKVALDRELMQQVINNLLENAFQAVKNQSTRRVRVCTRAGDENVELLISDTGEGMDAETRDKVFAPFFTTKKEGNGLGLAIARRIIRKHGGRLWCESEKGKGTTFGIALRFEVESDSG